MPNRSGVWDLRQVGVNEVNELWKESYPNPRALFAGEFSGNANGINYITIGSTGNAQDFGDLTNNETNGVSCASTSHGGIS